VKTAAVGLNNQAGITPEEVRLEPATAGVKGDVDLGRRKPAMRHMRRNMRSSSLRVLFVSGRSSSRRERSRATPRRPRLRRSRARRADRSTIRSTSASASAFLSCHTGMTAARSSSVRSTLVHGIPRMIIQSLAGRECRCASMPGGCRPRRFGAVTSTGPRSASLRPHRAAAERCDKTAPGPPAKTAAIQRPSRESSECPTA
jgi:hypothetical protein